ncbi:MAG: thioredoxin family protein [Candidatus Doudnabacteria bacterium]|nr:thioredoxin family protein [Candidatus Doudnabacteria bacterium]
MDVKVTELSTPGCSHCAEAKKFLEEEFKPKYPQVKVEYVSVLDPAGQELVQKHMIFASPGIILNDELFSTGGLDKNKLINKVNELLKA